MLRSLALFRGPNEAGTVPREEGLPLLQRTNSHTSGHERTTYSRDKPPPVKTMSTLVRQVKSDYRAEQRMESDGDFVGMERRLADIQARFARIWLFHYIDKLKEKKAKDKAKYYRPRRKQDDNDATESTENTMEEEGTTGNTSYEDLLVVYGPSDKQEGKPWEVDALLEISKKATNSYRLAIFFMSGDRTLAWWSSGDPQFLAVCFLRGIGTGVSGLKGVGKVGLKFEPDALFRGYMEMSDCNDIECRLSHVNELYEFGSPPAHSDWEYLASALVASVIACSLMVVGRSQIDDPGVKAITALSLSGLLAFLGQQHWPGLYMTARTCVMGCYGGVSGLLVSKRCRTLDRYIHQIELPAVVITTLVMGRGNGWKYVVAFSALSQVPLYVSAFLRNRCGEGRFWRLPLGDRQFIVADAVSDEGDKAKEFFRRPIYTRRIDYDGDRFPGKKEQPDYPPAYARGFGISAMAAWGVGVTPGKTEWSSFSYYAVLLSVVECLLALSALVCATTGCGAGVFILPGCVSMFKMNDGDTVYLKSTEMTTGSISFLISAVALAGTFVPDSAFDIPTQQASSLKSYMDSYSVRVVVYGVIGFLLWITFLGFFFEKLTYLLAKGSCRFLEWRIQLAQKSRKSQNSVEARNKSSTDHWDDLSKCRFTVPTTFIRVLGFGYYDGPQFNVRSGWYYPACGRVTLSVPRSDTFEESREEKYLLGLPGQDARNMVAIAPSKDLAHVDTYDTFLVHAGEQKRVEIATMKDYLSGGEKKLKCFVDDDDLEKGGNPSEEMQTALETCRHAVVVISADFLDKPYPMSELTYIFRRHEWIGNQEFHWKSLWVVLYKIKIKDYEEARMRYPTLPDLSRKLSVFEFDEKDGYRGLGWNGFVNEVKDEIIKQDAGEDGARRKWKELLLARANNQHDFPKAADVYQNVAS